MRLKSSLLDGLDELDAWGIVATDVELVITRWNRWMERASGLLATQTVGRPLLDVFPDLTSRNMERFYRQALNGQAVILSQKLHRYLLPLPPSVPGEWKQMQQTVRLAPLTEGQQVVGTVTLIEDVTERVAAEHELRQQATELTTLNRNKDEFLATLAHELRNPLAPIKTALQLMELESPDQENLSELRRIMSRQVDQMVRLIDDLLDVSRISRGKVNVRKSLVEMRPIVEMAVEATEPIVAEFNHQLTVEQADTPLTVEADSVRLVQVLTNLITNAAKYTPPGGQIGLTTAREGDQVVLRVQDNGVGIASDRFHEIFSLFSQVDRSLHRSQGGLGIGLTLVRSIVQLHGGSIEVQSDGEDRGSTFIVRLPFTPGEPARPMPNNSTEEIDLPPLKILIVEDTSTIAFVFSRVLKTMGHTVEVASNGVAALALLQRFAPDVIFSDIAMPEMDGYELARRLRSHASAERATIVATTGYGQEADRNSALAAGFDYHLVKPIDVTDLNSLFRQIAQRRPAIRSGST